MAARPRNVLPKPKQKPHPPLWVACSRRETILVAARKGLGALTFAFVEPEEAKPWVDEYYGILASDQCVAGGHFFRYSLAHYYVFGEHLPGRTNVWEEFQQKRSRYGLEPGIVKAEDAP